MTHFTTGRGSGLLVLLFFLGGCASPSIQQRRSYQNRTFDRMSYDLVFKAFKKVLSEETYGLRAQNPVLGILSAGINKSTGALGQIIGEIDKEKREGYEISINIRKSSATAFESRISVQRIKPHSLGGLDGQEILEPAVYAEFYERVMRELDKQKKGPEPKPEPAKSKS